MLLSGARFTRTKIGYFCFYFWSKSLHPHFTVPGNEALKQMHKSAAFYKLGRRGKRLPLQKYDFAPAS